VRVLVRLGVGVCVSVTETDWVLVCEAVWLEVGVMEPVRTGVKVMVSVGVGDLVSLGIKVPVSVAVSEGR
jgi:hypothetical protein